MGYCISLRDSKFCIKCENFRKALAAIKADQDIQTNHYNSMRNTAKSKTLERAFACLGYDVDYNDDGDIVDISFGGDKYSEEEYLFRAIAPYVESGSYLRYVGDDEVWIWKFMNGEMQEERL